MSERTSNWENPNQKKTCGGGRYRDKKRILNIDEQGDNGKQKKWLSQGNEEKGNRSESAKGGRRRAKAHRNGFHVTKSFNQMVADEEGMQGSAQVKRIPWGKGP